MWQTEQSQPAGPFGMRTGQAKASPAKVASSIAPRYPPPPSLRRSAALILPASPVRCVRDECAPGADPGAGGLVGAAVGGGMPSNGAYAMDGSNAASIDGGRRGEPTSLTVAGEAGTGERPVLDVGDEERVCEADARRLPGQRDDIESDDGRRAMPEARSSIDRAAVLVGPAVLASGRGKAGVVGAADGAPSTGAPCAGSGGWPATDDPAEGSAESALRKRAGAPTISMLERRTREGDGGDAQRVLPALLERRQARRPPAHSRGRAQMGALSEDGVEPLGVVLALV